MLMTRIIETRPEIDLGKWLRAQLNAQELAEYLSKLPRILTPEEIAKLPGRIGAP